MTPTNRRQQWAEQRRSLEQGHYKVRPNGKKFRKKYDLFKSVVGKSSRFLKIFGFEKWGSERAKKLEKNSFSLPFNHLPKDFSGYRILHLTDLHLDRLPGIEEAILQTAGSEPIDLVVFTGDYQEEYKNVSTVALAQLRKIIEGLSPKDGFIATLGNHDNHQIVPFLEEMGIRLLINETYTLRRGESEMHITGTDDVHHFYTPQAKEALESSPSGFKIALIHSPELPVLAEKNGYSLYLNGHTHGGQICLPGGIPIFTHLDIQRKYATGFWKLGELIGYSNRGAGVTTAPCRIFCPGEIAFFTLLKEKG